MDLEIINEGLWTLLFLPLYACCGISLTVRCGFLPFRRFGKTLRMTLGEGERQQSGLSPSQAANTALAATVGTGNIIGTAQAIAMGGPGAVFWLWTAAGLGMTIKYAEILHGLQDQGGAMGYIRAVLGRAPAGFYALLAVFSALIVGNMAQMNGALGAICHAIGHEYPVLRPGLGVILVSLVGISIKGGAGRVGQIMERLIPVMTLSYLLVTSAVMIVFHSRILVVIRLIVKEAFHPRAISGAALGKTIQWGLRRGSFSNEAGLGTAANIHAFVQTDRAPIHALWGILEVFTDTLVLCTATALAILCSGAPIPYGRLPGAELLEGALAAILGAGPAGIYVAAALLLFGISTVIGVYVSAYRCFRWLCGNKGEGVFQTIYLLFAFLGCILPLELIWRASDWLNVLMACPNLLSLFILAPQTGKIVRDSFFRRTGTPPGKKAAAVSCPNGKNGVQ